MSKARSSSTTDTKPAKLRRLSAWQWMVLLFAPFVLLLTWARLRYSGYQKTLLKTQADFHIELPASGQLLLARETAYAVAVAVRYMPWNPSCLSRSLALAWFLGRKGLAFDVLLGVPAGETLFRGVSGADFSAHAWVEHAGSVLNDKASVRNQFRVFEVGQTAQKPPPSSQQRSV